MKLKSKKNPFRLIYWDIKKTEKQILKNNTLYWKWEIKWNGLKLP